MFFPKTIRNKLSLLAALIIVAAGLFVLNQMLILKKAHSTFENYYVFRGCTQLLKKDDSYAICKTKTNEILKLVQFHNKWYLDGDLPFCLANICL